MNQEQFPQPKQDSPFEHPTGTEYLTPEVADAIDLFRLSKEVSLSSVPEDSVLTVKDIKGKPIAFYHGKNGFELLYEDEKQEGHERQIKRIPITIIGSSVTPSTFYKIGDPSIVERGYLHFQIKYNFRSGASSPEFFNSLDFPENLDPTILQENLNMGLVQKHDDGNLYWHLGIEQPPIGPVKSAQVISPDGIRGLIGGESV